MRQSLALAICALVLTSCQTVVIQPRPEVTRRPLPPFQGQVSEPVFGGRIYLYETGRRNRETIVLVHGLDHRASGVWQKQLTLLAEDYHLLAIDLPGFGRSSKANELYSPTNYAHVLRAVIDRRVDGEFVLIGHGLGGMAALRYASMYPRDLERLVLVDVAGVLHHRVLADFIADSQAAGPFPETVTQPLPGVVADDTDAGAKIMAVLESRERRREILKEDPVRIASLATLQTDVGPILSTIKAPTLVVWGADDNVAPKRVAKLLAARLPNARHKILPRVGHTPMVQAPEQFNEVLREFLDDPSPSPPLMPAVAAPATETLECDGREDVTFSGDYRKVIITDSTNIRLLNVTAQSITILRSSVVIENSRVIGKGTALSVKSARVSITGTDLFGATAIDSTASFLDLAGARLRGDKTGIYTDTRSELLFSASRCDSPALTGWLHGPYKSPLPDK